jgi:hypothetical protein
VQANSPFWNRKKKKTQLCKSKAAPALRRNKPAVANEPVAGDESPTARDESEVELDSLGRLFIELADASYSQDNTEMSRASDAEVISISSGSKNLSPKKIRRVVRKVKFSHPNAYLDPKFLFKKAHHEGTSRRQTRSGSGELVAGLPNIPSTRKRRIEVPYSPTLSLPQAGLFRRPLYPSDSNYQELLPSSGGSTSTQLPPFTINQG